MAAIDYQRRIQPVLERHFDYVELEWPVVKNATDALARDISRYGPRVDIAIGPFSTTPGRDPDILDAPIPERLRELFDDPSANPNPRCLLAIEVVFSGSSKHVMGDILNAGALGLYGIVVGSEEMMPKVDSIFRYLEVLERLRKSRHRLFPNVVPLSTADLDALLA